jgi:hypothetical protein
VSILTFSGNKLQILTDKVMVGHDVPMLAKEMIPGRLYEIGGRAAVLQSDVAPRGITILVCCIEDGFKAWVRGDCEVRELTMGEVDEPVIVLDSSAVSQ